MKCFFSLLFILTASISSFGQDPNITSIYDGPFEDVLREAKRINKPIFLNFSADWCAHCQKMEKQAFSDLNIAQKLNNEVIAYKVNAEDVDGKALIAQFKISDFPTYLIIDANSKVIGKIKGYWKAPQFYKELQSLVAIPQNEPTAAKQKEGFFKRRRAS
jgi:thioredoxin 1